MCLEANFPPSELSLPFFAAVHYQMTYHAYRHFVTTGDEMSSRMLFDRDEETREGVRKALKGAMLT